MNETHEIALLCQPAEQAAAVRTEMLQGREHRVIPSVLVRSQVLHNNLGRAFLPASDISDEWASMWNGVPVLVGEHPQSRGVAISGRQPCLWDARGAGWIFKAKAEQQSANIRRLTAEVWIDVTRASGPNAVPGLQEVLDKVDAGGIVELSTGFPVEIENTAGNFEGNAYAVIMHPAGVDHLVVSATMTGACSVQHGCGLGANEAAKDGKQAVKDRALRSVGAERGRAGTSFRSVVERASQEAAKTMKMLWTKKDKAAEPQLSNSEMNAAREELARQSIPASDQEHYNMVRDALQDKFGGQDRTVVVNDCYSSTTPKLVVFWYSTPFGPTPEGSEYFQAEYTETGTAQFTFTEPIRVRRMTVYEVVGNSAASAANSTHTAGAEDSIMNDADKKELATMLEAIVTPLTARLAAIEAGATKTVEAATNAAKEAVAAVAAETKTLIEAVSNTVKGLATTVNAERDAERVALAKELSSNSKTPFTAAELEGKPLEELRKIAELANVPVADYSGRGGPRSSTNSSVEAQYAEPLPYFKKADAAAATTTSEAK